MQHGPSRRQCWFTPPKDLTICFKSIKGANWHQHIYRICTLLYSVFLKITLCFDRIYLVRYGGKVTWVAGLGDWWILADEWLKGNDTVCAWFRGAGSDPRYRNAITSVWTVLMKCTCWVTLCAQISSVLCRNRESAALKHFPSLLGIYMGYFSGIEALSPSLLVFAFCLKTEDTSCLCIF